MLQQMVNCMENRFKSLNKNEDFSCFYLESAESVYNPSNEFYQKTLKFISFGKIDENNYLPRFGIIYDDELKECYQLDTFIVNIPRNMMFWIRYPESIFYDNIPREYRLTYYNIFSLDETSPQSYFDEVLEWERQIILNPTNKCLKLVYADWLAERGVGEKREKNLRG